MTRIFTEGAEMGDVLFFDVPSSYTVSGTKRSGTYSFYNGTVLAGATKYISPISEFYARFAFWVDIHNSAASNYFFTWQYDSNIIGGIGINGTTRLINLLVNGAEVATAGLFTFSHWYLFEVHVKIDNSGQVDVKIDGNQDITYSGDTLFTYSTVNQLVYRSFYSNSNYFDDLALNDTTGTTDNSWCGDGHVVKITPSGSGTNNNWLNNGGVSASANYLYVDEYPNDGDTTYVYCSASSTGVQDQYNMSSFTTPIGSYITRIMPECRARKATSSDMNINIGYLPDGGTTQLSGSQAISSINYGRYTGTSASANPVTGSGWTDTDINALQYVIEVA